MTTPTYRVILGYLVHHGYTSTAVQFATSTGLELNENVDSMRNRQGELINHYQLLLN